MKIFDKLKDKGISTRQIARELKIDSAVVSKVLNNKYNGSEETKQRVLDYIDFVLQDKEDLNQLIYSNPDVMIKATHLLIKHPRLNNDETRFIIKLNDIVTNYKQKKDEQDRFKKGN